MKPEEKAVRDIQNLLLAQGERDLAKLAVVLSDHVLEVHGPGMEGDPFGSTPPYGEQTWRHSFHLLVEQHDWRLPAERMLHALRDMLLERQRQESRLFDTAHLSQYLTESQYERGSLASAFRWAMHTHAADVLAGRPNNGFGSLWLYGAFGVSSAERSTLDTLAEQCLSEAKSEGGWSRPCGFPEEAVRRLSASAGAGSDLFARTLALEEFPMCRPFFGALVDTVEAETDHNKKGSRLEDVAEYLFGLLPGCIPRRNVLDIAGAAEHDLVVANHFQQGSLTSDLFGRYFLVECKNWAKAVSVSDLGYFLFRLRQSKSSFGVMFARSGITGRPEAEDNSRALVRRSFHEDGITCVVIAQKQIAKLCGGQQSSFLTQLLCQLEAMRYGTPKSAQETDYDSWSGR